MYSILSLYFSLLVRTIFNNWFVKFLKAKISSCKLLRVDFSRLCSNFWSKERHYILTPAQVFLSSSYPWHNSLMNFTMLGKHSTGLGFEPQPRSTARLSVSHPCQPWTEKKKNYFKSHHWIPNCCYFASIPYVGFLVPFIGLFLGHHHSQAPNGVFGQQFCC